MRHQVFKLTEQEQEALTEAYRLLDAEEIEAIEEEILREHERQRARELVERILRKAVERSK